MLPINVFHHREELLKALRGGVGLRSLIRRMGVGSFLCATGYGLVLGAQVGGWQVLSSPVKLCLVLLGTTGLCVAALYVMLALAGQRLGWGQVVGLALCSVSASALCMAALLPITAFWALANSSPDRAPLVLAHATAFGIAGWVGTRFGMEMARALFPVPRAIHVFTLWLWLFGLAAQQMAWIFRPHFHATTTFMHPLASGGTALQRLWDLITGTLFR